MDGLANLQGFFRDILFTLPGIIIGMTIHEFSHGFAAYKLGDKTAKAEGRLSLNPLRHLDPVGILTLIIFRFGWAKPVNVSTAGFKNPKVDMALTAAAGPLSNLITAFVFTIAFVPLLLLQHSAAAGVLQEIVANIIIINLSLGFFNMLPLPPLDGSKILGAFLPDNLYMKYLSLEKIGVVVLLGLIFFGVTGKIISPLINATFQGMYSIVSNIFLFFMK